MARFLIASVAAPPLLLRNRPRHARLRGLGALLPHTNVRSTRADADVNFLLHPPHDSSRDARFTRDSKPAGRPRGGLRP